MIFQKRVESCNLIPDVPGNCHAVGPIDRSLLQVPDLTIILLGVLLNLSQE